MTKVNCGAVVCLNNKEGLCTLEEIQLYTGSEVFCPECDELNTFPHDLVDCANYKADPNFKYELVER